MKGEMTSRRKGNLSPRYIGPSEILWRVGEVAYEIFLPQVFFDINSDFHVSMLHRYVHDESHVLQYDAIDIEDHLTFVKELVSTPSIDVQWLSPRATIVVKVYWRHYLVEEPLSEAEHDMRE
ncbi:hypothetical protein MTR67_022920 [Solanum verrucosum]|uniref:Tf2-1-like SH3-like domain-containing protein n=1 Tax=Solanum verrucosum TaxID=315347 RepID=A0AAF0QYR0_SOLVR|nr:hypothetical protein MTR67_022920 [Solanum verrucosum]